MRTLCMGALGGLYRPTPQGYNGKSGWVWVPAVCLSGAIFSADSWGPPAGRVLPAADYCSRASNDAGLVMGLWQQ